MLINFSGTIFFTDHPYAIAEEKAALKFIDELKYIGLISMKINIQIL